MQTANEIKHSKELMLSLRVLAHQRSGYHTRNLAENPGRFTVRMRQNSRGARVSRLGNPRINWNVSKQRNTEFLCSTAASALTEDVFLMTSFWATKNRHVFDNANHRNVNLPKHVQPFTSIYQRNILRRSNDDGTVKWR